MNLRPLGRSALQVSPLCFGGNVFGWTADEKTSFSLLDAWLDAGFNFIDTADVYSRWAPGHTGGESETVIGKWLKQSRQARQGRDRHQGRHGHGRRQGGPEGRLHPARGRRFAAAPADRPHRPVPGAQGRRGHAAGGNAGGVRRPDQAGQGARDRRLQLQRRAAGARRWRPASGWACRATRRCSRCTTCTTARCSRRTCSRCACARSVGVINFYALAAGFLTGKYRKPDDAAKSPRGDATIEEVPQRARPEDPGGARRGRAAAGQHAGPGGDRLGDGAARRWWRRSPAPRRSRSWGTWSRPRACSWTATALALLDQASAEA